MFSVGGKHFLAQKRFVSSSIRLLNKDYYGILAVSKNASSADIKKAYYEQAKKHHPDRNPGDTRAESLFQDISEAYDVLSDEKKRDEYDSVASTSAHGSYTFTQRKQNKSEPDTQRWKYQRKKDPIEQFKEVFGDLNSNFSAQDYSSFAHRKIPRAIVVISFQEAACGASKLVKFQSGDGIINEFDGEVLVEIPPGVEDGQTVRLKVDGVHEAIAQVKLDESGEFQRRHGSHFYSEVWVDIWDAALGNIIELPGLYGKIRVRLPKRLKSHTVLALPGQGFQHFSIPGKFGDHFVTVKIKSIELERKHESSSV